MDRALKERVLGAVVLVVLAVLVVPVFLDGPTDDATTVTESITLPGQESGGGQKTIVLDRDREEPVPAAVQRSDATNNEAPEQSTEQLAVAAIDAPKQQAPTPQKEVVSEQVSTPADAPSSTGMWAVQLGSFSNKENAERLAADLRKQGYAAFLSQLESDGDALQRVRVGPQKDRPAAEAVAAKLSAAGHPGQVVPHP